MPDLLTVPQIEAALERAEKATPGIITWRLAPESDPDERMILTTADGESEITGIIYREDDAEFFASARTDVPALARTALALWIAVKGAPHAMTCSLVGKWPAENVACDCWKAQFEVENE